MPSSVLLTITNNYFMDSTLNIKSSLVLLLQSTPLVLALSSKMSTYYYPPPTTSLSLLFSSPTCSDIE